MTIQNTTIRKAGPSQGNGVNVSFPFTFKVFASADVLVTYLDAIGTESSLVLSTDYTVALNADQNIAPGGAVTLLWTPASSTYITLTSQVSNTQNLALTNAGGFYPTSINDALDRIVIQVQQLAELISRSAKAPLSGIGSLTASSLVFGVDATGAPILSSLASISSTAVSTFMNTLLSLTSASAVKTALSVQSDLQTQANTAVLTTGTSTAYIALPSPTIATPTANTRLRVKFHLASGVTPTLTVGSVTANLQQYDATGALVTATLGLNQLTDVEYNGSEFVVLNPLLQTAGDARYAKLAGLSTQAFAVANGTTGNNAVNFSQFPVTLAAAGSQTLPGGLILKWGIKNSVATGAWTNTYPTAFPTACVFATNTPTELNSIAQTALVVTAIAAGSFASVNSTGIVNNFRWFAIGY